MAALTLGTLIADPVSKAGELVAPVVLAAIVAAGLEDAIGV
ncbi:MAG: hypothetical protein QOH44_2234, partial [Actinomycetota bacterium]|nr:hypothetical protein [Actinomycetota bacterium]